MRKQVKKAVALFSAALMVVGSIPVSSLAPISVYAADEEQTAEVSAYVLNASDLDAVSLAGGLDTALTTDTVVGTGDYFTLSGTGGKVKINQPGEVVYGTNTFNQCVYLTGGLKASGQAGIKVEIPEDKTAKVTVFAAAKSDAASNLRYFNKAGTATDIDALTFGEVGKYTINDLSSGTYWLGGSNGAYVYYLEVKYTEKYELDMAISEAAAGDISADTAMGTSDFFTVMGVESKNKVVDLSAAPITYGDTVYKKAITLGGKLSTSNGKSGLKFTTVSNATVRIVAGAKSESASALWYAPVGGATVGVQDGDLAYGEAKEYTISNLPAGSYYIGGSNGANIYDITVEYVSAYTLDPNDTATFDAAFDGSSGEMTADTAVGTDDYFTLISTGSKIKNPELNLAYNGTTYAKALRLDGGAKTSGQACFKINVTENARVTILATGKNDKGSKLEYVKVGGTAFTAFSDGLVKDSISEYVLEDLLPGEYYIGSDQGADIFSVVVEYDAETLKAAEWDTVAAPVINNVTVNDEGNFVVDFTAVIDKVKGAENVRVSMLESGYEFSTINVTSQKSQVIFQPLWSGNYTFVVTAQRTGEADKVSEVFKYDNYVLAVKKPVITWAQNKGNGSVYLDWVNIEDADSYKVSYKEAEANDYTVAATLTGDQGDYALTGLTAGKIYDIKIEATRNSDNFTSFATKTVEVKAEADQPWYVATVGSAQATDVTVTKADGSTVDYNLNSSDSSATKTNLSEAVDIANSTTTVDMKGQSSGKISDDEDGYSYYFTKIDPNTENFKIGATFEITDTSLTPDNQTGFGIIAADTLGINNWGNPDYVHKYFNYASSMFFSSKTTNPVLRTVSGYTSADSSNNDGAERTIINDKFSDVSANFTVGNKYTFTLEKTDEGYTATCNGSEKKYADNSFTSVQEDGTVVVGIMVSRKVSVKVTDITFTKSASQGITSGNTGDEKIRPDGRVYSTGTCGAAEYEYIYVPNCAGTLTVSGENGVAVEKKAVAANEVVRVAVPIKLGSNTVKSVFIPTAADNITSTEAVEKETTVKCVRYGTEGQTIIVSADGSADGLGTEESPLDIATAVKYAQPGQTIFVKNGVYKNWVTIDRSVSGTADKYITMVAESVSTNGTDGVVFEGAGITVVGSYWHIYGMYVKDSTGVGIQISGNNNIIEMCTVNHAANSGIQISRNGGADNEAGRVGRLWPSDNLVKNCESFDNCDSGRNDADGFAAKLTCGDGNVFYGCIGHNNIDDGWDLYAKSVSGEIGAVQIINCVAYNNGWLTTDDVTAAGYVYGEGNGFKLGGGYLKGGHVLKNSITFGNHGKGITSNSCPDCKIISCISYNNSLNNDAYNVGLNTKDSNVKAWEVTGLISLNNNKNTKLEDLIPFSLHNENNYIYDGSASYNSKGEQAADDWFVNVDISVAPERNADGTINMHDLLLLKDTTKNTGCILDVTSDEAKSVKPEKTTVVDGKQDAPVVDFTELDKAIAAAELLKAEDYKDFTAVEAALAAAKSVDKTTAKQEDVDKLTKVLNDAVAALEKAETPEDKKNGLVIGEDGSILYYENGVVSTTFTGMATDDTTGRKYWFDAGVAARDKEAYDSVSNGWYWFDADGTMATNKDVNIPDGTQFGKWVRYDENGIMVKGEDYRYDGWYRFDEITGAMIKGWYTTDDADNKKLYYYDDITGQMVHGAVVISGENCAFDDVTGVALNCAWYTIDGNEFWYENGKRQGTEGRGKEIYDPATDAWYWLDSIDGGKKAKSKDVYQESWAGIYGDNGEYGKWVRYDENGHMVKGWDEQNGNTYYFDMITGAMAKRKTTIDGKEYIFDMYLGIMIK